MNMLNNGNIATSILVIIVIIMSILGTTSFVLFFTHCPSGCKVNTISKEGYKQRKYGKNGNTQKEKNYTQLIPLDDILNSF